MYNFTQKISSLKITWYVKFLYWHGFPEHTETIIMDPVSLAPVGIVDELTLSGHRQTSTKRHKPYIKLQNLVYYRNFKIIMW